MSRMTVIYRVRSDSKAIAARAEAIAVEQSVEMPLSAISDEVVLRDIIGEVQEIHEIQPDLFEVRIGLSVLTMGADAGQLLNMLFGNTSLHDDVSLWDAEFPAELLSAFGGPRQSIAELRDRCQAHGRAMTCTALKPQGLPPSDLASLAGRLAEGGLDFIKDDHGLADQAYSPFGERMPLARRPSARQTRAPASTPAMCRMCRAILTWPQGKSCSRSRKGSARY